MTLGAARDGAARDGAVEQLQRGSQGFENLLVKPHRVPSLLGCFPRSSLREQQVQPQEKARGFHVRQEREKFSRQSQLKFFSFGTRQK